MMKEDVKRLLPRAEESINASQLLLDEQMPGFAVSRAYYAMFYCAEALLLEQQLAFSKHSAVIAAFGEHFAKTGKLNPEFHRYLRDAFDQRVVGDYDVLSEISEETARSTLANARKFLQATRYYLESR